MKSITKYLIMWSILIVVISRGPGTCRCEPDSTSKDRNQMSRRLTANKYQLKELDHKKYQSIIMKDFAICSTPGKPMLPYRIEDLVIPEHVDLSSVQLQFSVIHSKILPSTYSVQPAPWPLLFPEHEISDEQESMQDKSIIFRDDTIYNKNAFFPAEPIMLMGIATKGTNNGRLIKIARVLYGPFQYNPTTGKIRLTSEVDVTISYRTYK